MANRTPSASSTPPPRESTGSEDIALANGRYTLEEVVSKLNDIDGNNRNRTNSAGNGLIIARMPFLSSLFPSNSSHSGIVVDEEDRDQEDNPLSDIFLWRFPLISIIWLLTLQLVFFLHFFADFTLFTICAVLAIWQLLVDFSLNLIVPFAQKQGLISDKFNIQDVIRKNTFFNASLNKRIAAINYEMADLGIGMWKVMVMEANLTRVFVAFRFVFFVFVRSMSVTATLWVVLMAFFTVPLSYRTHRMIADIIADSVDVRTQRFKTMIVSLAEKAHVQSVEHPNSVPLKIVNLLATRVKCFFVGS